MNEVSIDRVFEQLGRLYVSRELLAIERERLQADLERQASLTSQFKAAYETANAELAQLKAAAAAPAPAPQE